jgi:hypothetical protein
MGEPASQQPRRSDRSGWNWLLLIPIVLPLIPALFNAEGPAVLGFPRFYWQQLAYVVVGVATTSLVYRMTRKRGGREG